MGMPLINTDVQGSNLNGEERTWTSKDKQPARQIVNCHLRSNSHSTPNSHLASAEDPAESVDNPGISASSVADHSKMHQNGNKLFAIPTDDEPPTTNDSALPRRPPLQWDWGTEHADRKKERKADAALHGSTPFEVDRSVLKDVVREKMGVHVGLITFLSAGTFHKAYLVTLVNHVELVARVARRFMPRLKTESEVATINYLRQKTNVPVPTIYHYDSNPYNRLGGEWILMSKAPGIPLSQVYHGLAYNSLVKLLKNLAATIIPIFAHRFTEIGSLYFGPDPRLTLSSRVPTPKAFPDLYSAFPFSPTLAMSGFPSITPKPSTSHVSNLQSVTREYHVGPIISWPFFGSNRDELTHPNELNRGPWPTTDSYLSSCAEREIKGVIRESEGKSAPHRLHLDPDEILSSRHHRLRAVPGDESDDSDEWNLEESEDEWEGPGDAMYRDYRRMQRSTFLIAHMKQREDAVRKEMERWMNVMDRLVNEVKKGDGRDEFGLDCHDLSLENMFVDEKDNTIITCIIDWESTTTRPLWACAHVPPFLQTSPFVSKLFREIVAQLPSDPTVNVQLPKTDKPIDLTSLCREWLYYESAGTRLRMAHRCAEWDGWEEGLVDSILGPEEFEHEWYKVRYVDKKALRAAVVSPRAIDSSAETTSTHKYKVPLIGVGLTRVVTLSSKLPLFQEKEKEQMLNTTGDICGGRGGELGRRLEAWLTVNGNGNGNGYADAETEGSDDEQKVPELEAEDHII